jgi:hypothetical protein
MVANIISTRMHGVTPYATTFSYEWDTACYGSGTTR